LNFGFSDLLVFFPPLTPCRKTLQVNLGSDKNKDVHLPYPLHPMLSRSYQILEPLFIEHVLPSTGHGLLATPEAWNGLLDELPESATQVRDMLSKTWDKSPYDTTPAEKWTTLKTHIKGFLKSTTKAGTGGKAAKGMSDKDRTRLENWCVEVVFRQAYPRLDVNVSKMRNHLLKSPFCVHPKTGRVCVPINDIDDFDPFVVPTLSQLMSELDEYNDVNNGDDEEGKNTDNQIADWQKTSLKGYFEPFQKEFLPNLLKTVRRKDRDDAEQQAALTGDF